MGISERKRAKEMKKFFSIVLILAICCGLGIYFYMDNMQKKIVEELVLPTVPHVAVPTLPAREGGEEATEEVTEPNDPTGETYPWETEFIEEDYNIMEGNAGDGGKGIFFLQKGESFMIRRDIVYWTNGDIEDTYYYQSGLPSHRYFWSTDGTFEEFRYLDDGRIETNTNGSVHSIWGTMIYWKEVQPDGSYVENILPEEGNSTEIRHDANGYYSKSEYDRNGNLCNYVSDDPATGTHEEGTYYDNGCTMRHVRENSQRGEYSETVYFENGYIKYNKYQTQTHIQEEHYDEAGFHIYFYLKDTNIEIELISDETGKLIKVIENGVTIEDTAIIAQYAQSYNFKE